MGLYEDFQKSNKTSKDGGLYGEFLKTQQPQQSTFSKAIDTTKSTVRGILDIFTKPAPAQQEFEKQVLPEYYKGDSKILKYATAPGTAIARGALKTFSRLISPGITPLTEDIAEIYEVSKKGGIADKVASGELPVSTLDDFKVLNKTAPQIIGDVSQAVLSFYGGSAAKNLATGGAKEGFKQAFKTGFKENAPLGLLFGASNLASESDFSGVPKEDVVKIATTLGISTATAGILSGILRGTIPATKTVQNKIAKVFEEKKIKILPQSTSRVTTNIKINTPKSIYTDYLTKQGYEPYLNPNELPVIDFGGKIKDDLPTIQINAKQKPVVSSGLDYVPEKAQSIVETATSIIEQGKKSPKLLKQATTPIKLVTQEPIRTQPKIVEPIGETIVPKLATRVEESAIERKLIERFEGLPEAQKMNMKQQAKDSADLVSADYERAKRIAMGDETPPGDLRDASVFEAVKQKALNDGDAIILKQLATESKIPGKLTAYGQEIKAADSMLGTSDPVEAMQMVIKAREKGKGNIQVAKTKDLSDMKKAVKANAPKKETWIQFINNLEC